jgi:hypothetical protein
VQYLSGTDKDHPVEWEFFCTAGRWSGFTTVIPVPSQWELLGFGRYDYGFQDAKEPEEGRYRHRFTVPPEWAERQVDLVFGGVMTDTEVRINGQLAGAVHRGGFTEFRYDITTLLRYPGPNLLEVTVREASANGSVNRAERDADYWLFGGIYRPVFLEARPEVGIRRLAVGDGSLTVDVHLQGVEETVLVAAVLWDGEGGLAGNPLSASVASGAERVRLAGVFPEVTPWTAETPTLYRLEVTLLPATYGGPAALHRVTETVGFRTVAVRPGDGLYLNGTKIRLKGINRHSFWPTSGRATSREVSLLDARLIRRMHFNAVRTAHYPPDPHFLEVCDRLGLYVLLELPGWHDAYDGEAGAPLVREMILRDVNHPSVILWSNGNEGGWNAALDPLFDTLDPQRRPLLHPDSDDPFRGLNTLHYRSYDELRRILYHEGVRGWWAGLWGAPDLYLSTEFLHGLYDGGHGAGLRDYWDAIRGAPNGVGGFLWAYVDEGVLRTDQVGKIDTYTNYGPDGIVGPYREPEGSFATVRRIFSPVQLALPERLPVPFEGPLTVTNEYHFTDLETLRFHWRLLRLEDSAKRLAPSAKRLAPWQVLEGEELAAGVAATGSILPGDSGVLDLTLPTGIEADALEIVAVDGPGEAVAEWVVPVGERSAGAVVQEEISPATCREEEGPGGKVLRLHLPGAPSVAVDLDAATGELVALRQGDRRMPLTAGPRFGATARPATVGCAAEEAGTVVVRDAGPLVEARWRLLAGGALDLTYRYTAQGLGPVHGPGFALPRDQVRAVRWRGRGPYRVWANRLEGPLYGVWRNEANDTMTGVTWTVPEFTGFFADPEWVEWELAEGIVRVEGIEGPGFFQNFHPGVPVDPRFTVAQNHPSAVAFLHGISGIGTKFHRAQDLGPQGRGTPSDAAPTGHLRFVFLP